MRRILHETEATSYNVYLGGGDNFRHTIYLEYKANRNAFKRPDWLQQCREILCTEYNASVQDGIETDDKLGIEQSISQHDESSKATETIICSIDKDLMMIPGWHYNFVKGEKSFVEPLEGLKRFYTQLIMGDPGDNIPGFDGKARQKVPKFLQPHVDFIWEQDTEVPMYSKLLELYDNDVDTLHRNAQLLWILREEGEQWQPPGVRDS